MDGRRSIPIDAPIARCIASQAPVNCVIRRIPIIDVPHRHPDDPHPAWIVIFDLPDDPSNQIRTNEITGWDIDVPPKNFDDLPLCRPATRTSRPVGTKGRERPISIVAVVIIRLTSPLRIRNRRREQAAPREAA